jgi:CHAT domain-containing protein
LAAGAIDYGASPGATLPGETARAAARGERGTAWKNLPATGPEVAAVATSFAGAFPLGTVKTLRAGEATEGAVRNLIGRHRWVHLATHGFFAAPTEQPVAAGPTAIADGRRAVGGFLPGLLSGVVLTGANRPFDPASDADDGILTAAEIATLDLRNVETVVLSACETGLGPVAGGEGVLGLQRAFQVAGARTVVASLWQVDDEATRRLMSRAYANWWSGKGTKLGGLVEAQRWLLKEGVAGPGGKPTKGRTPPHYWAAFVLSGDWR